MIEIPRQSPQRVVIAGGSGFLGLSLATYLAAAGKQIVLLSRHPPRAVGPWKHVPWDARTSGAWQRDLDGASALINRHPNGWFASARGGFSGPIPNSLSTDATSCRPVFKTSDLSSRSRNSARHSTTFWPMLAPGRSESSSIVGLLPINARYRGICAGRVACPEKYTGKVRSAHQPLEPAVGTAQWH